jgi:hypothetical protein
MQKIDKKKIIEFKFLSDKEKVDSKYTNWSRMYEYPIVIDFITKYFNISPYIHNTACGFAKIHKLFSDDLNSIGNCFHSDIIKSEITNNYYDIREEDKKLENKFDVVLNISTLEHIKEKNCIDIINILYKQVKKDGYLICTFDFPTVDLKEIERYLKVKCQEIENKLYNSDKKLNIVLLIIKK